MNQSNTIALVQNELRPWQEHNFPNRSSWEPILGLVEEVGELSHSYLKNHQNIRIEEDHISKMRDAVGDIVVYLCDFCNAMGFDLDRELRDTWGKVSKRDWQKDRTGKDKPS